MLLWSTKNYGIIYGLMTSAFVRELLSEWSSHASLNSVLFFSSFFVQFFFHIQMLDFTSHFLLLSSVYLTELQINFDETSLQWWLLCRCFFLFLFFNFLVFFPYFSTIYIVTWSFISVFCLFIYIHSLQFNHNKFCSSHNNVQKVFIISLCVCVNFLLFFFSFL